MDRPRPPRPASPGAASPCVGLCRVEPTTRLCEGCLRTIDEIASWGSLTNARREEITADLPGRAPRLAAIRRPPPTLG